MTTLHGDCQVVLRTFSPSDTESRCKLDTGWQAAAPTLHAAANSVVSEGGLELSPAIRHLPAIRGNQRH